MNLDIGTLLSNGGPWGALLALLWVIGNRMVGAIDRLGLRTEQRLDRSDAKLDENTKATLRVEAKVEALEHRWNGVGATASTPTKTTDH